MNGVTVIEEIVCREASLGVTIVGIVCTLLTCALALVVYKKSYKYMSSACGKKLICTFSALTVAAFIFVFCSSIADYSNTHIEYIVEVSEDTSLTEFMDKYAIISGDGKIFRVLEEKDD